MKIIRNLFKPSQQETNEGSTAQEQAESDAPVTEASPETTAKEAPYQGQDTPSDEAHAQSVEPQKAVQPEPEPFVPFAEAKQRVLQARAGADQLRSVLFFTTHKCASTFVTELLDELDAQSPYSNMNYEGAYWELGDAVEYTENPIQSFMPQNYDVLFRQHGEIYGPLRKPFDFPGRENFKHIFFLRDPRDVLVSMFFSYAYTHPEPTNAAAREAFLKTRAEMQDNGIDAFVLQMAMDNVLPRYVGYSELAQNLDDPLILRYDEFASDTEAFLQKMSNYLQIELSPESLAKLSGRASPIRQGAPEMSHKRSGKSGQWQHELKPETRRELNQILKPALENWGF